MGNTCSSRKHQDVEEGDSEVDVSQYDVPKEFIGTSIGFLPAHERNEQMDTWLREIQKHNLNLMKEEFKTDLNGFILNNLLLCVQFVDNFET